MSKNFFLGIDTSNYTTSLAIVDENANIVCEKKRLLDISDNMKGLRQQEAVFQHNKYLPILYEKLIDESNIDIKNIRAVCASIKPRNIENSYMPCFKVGESFAKVISKSLSINFYETSHQDGHIKAIENFVENISDDFFVLHFSGGTTEILSVEKGEKDYIINKIGGTLDISFGQLLDRVGIKLGFKFPAGHEIDQHALKENVKIGRLKNVKDIKVDNFNFNLSGLESHIYREIDKNYLDNNLKIEISKLLMRKALICIKNIIDNLKMYDCENDNKNLEKQRDIIIAGGVSESIYLRNHLLSENIHFGRYGKDNAVGVALIGGEFWRLNQ